MTKEIASLRMEMTREKFRHTDEIQKYREKLETNLKQYQGEILKKD